MSRILRILDREFEVPAEGLGNRGALRRVLLDCGEALDPMSTQINVLARSDRLGLATAEDLVKLVSRGGFPSEVKQFFAGRVGFVDVVRQLVDPDDVGFGVGRPLPAFGELLDNDKLRELTINEDFLNDLHFYFLVCAHERSLLAGRLR